jgi:hypothetical protein
MPHKGMVPFLGVKFYPHTHMPVLSYGEMRIKHSKKGECIREISPLGVGFKSLPLAYSGWIL